MRMLRHIVWLLGCVSGLLGPAYAESTPKDRTTTVVQDSASAVQLRQFDQASLNRYKAHTDFQYDEQPMDLSWWQRLKQWVRDRLADLLTRDGSYTVLKNIGIIAGIAALVYLIVRLLGMDAIGLFSRKSREAGLPFSEHPETIHGIDFAAALQKAIETGNYRLGVRLLYLDCLKKLSDSGHIDWQPAKTNATYVAELTGDSVQTAFKRLTRQFEYIWYGDFGIDHQHFMQLHTAFQQFDEELK